METNDLNFEAKSFFKVIRKIRYNWKNSSKKKSFFRDIYSKLLNFKNSYGIKNFTKLIKFIKSEFLIKYNFEALNYAFCYKKPKKFEEDFKFVYQNLSDKQSKDYYYEFYYGNFQKNFDKFLFNHLNCIQYSDYINLDKDSVILNCGVRAGFEIPIYLSKNVKQIYNIDPSGAKHLDPYVRKHMEIKTKTEMKFIHEALYSADSVYGISKSNLNITSLEKIIKKFNINNIDLIKSDIEGGERVMADELIYICNKFRPQLAISIYHNNYDKKKFILNDGVEIPKKLIKNLKNYNFYFKHYSFDKNEAIFYTIPN